MFLQCAQCKVFLTFSTNMEGIRLPFTSGVCVEIYKIFNHIAPFGKVVPITRMSIRSVHIERQGVIDWIFTFSLISQFYKIPVVACKALIGVEESWIDYRKKDYENYIIWFIEYILNIMYWPDAYLGNLLTSHISEYVIVRRTIIDIEMGIAIR